MKILLLGRGGREHALARRLAEDEARPELWAFPGNDGMGPDVTRIEGDEGDGAAVVRAALDRSIDLCVVGPEAPLVRGVADALRSEGVAVFGPSRSAAKLEGSKAFAKDVMQAAGVPTARWHRSPDAASARSHLEAQSAPWVVKADGLAAGKGVIVPDSIEAAVAAVERLETQGLAGDGFVLEERLAGPEVSLFSFCDGTRVHSLVAAQDHKRLADGDAGPNTGGMGAFSPSRILRDGDLETVQARCVQPVVDLMRGRGVPFVGVLFTGLMWTADGPKVLEYNVRFGDPEAQAILPRLAGPLAETLMDAALGRMHRMPLSIEPIEAVTVVLAAPGYPSAPQTGAPISGLPEAEATGALICHAGTTFRDGTWRTAGGRVLGVTGLGPTREAARTKAYAAAACIHFEGMQYRRDIAADGSV